MLTRKMLKRAERYEATYGDPPAAVSGGLVASLLRLPHCAHGKHLHPVERRRWRRIVRDAGIDVVARSR